MTSYESEFKGSTLGAAIDVIGWLLFGLCLLVAVFAALSGEGGIAGSAAAGALGGLVLITLGTTVSKLNSIEYFTRGVYRELSENRKNEVETLNRLRNVGAPAPSGNLTTEG